MNKTQNMNQEPEDLNVSATATDHKDLASITDLFIEVSSPRPAKASKVFAKRVDVVPKQGSDLIIGGWSIHTGKKIKASI